MLARLAVPHERLSLCIEILLGGLDALAHWPRRRDVEDAHAGTRAFGDFNAVESGAFIGATGADGPNLPRRQWIGRDGVLTLQLGGGDVAVDTIVAELIAEVRVAELGAADPLLLLFDPAP